MVQDRDSNHPLGSLSLSLNLGMSNVRHVGSFKFSGDLAFPFVPSVLKPNLDLSFCEV